MDSLPSPGGSPDCSGGAGFIFEPEMVRCSITAMVKKRDGGMTLGQAIMVQFLSALGAGMALVAWYPKLCGYLLFPVALVLVSVTATIGAAAIMDVAVRTNAGTFSELCDSLPRWMRFFAEVGTAAWFLCCLSMYIELISSAINSQVFASMGSGPWPWGEAVPGAGKTPLYFLVGGMVFLVTSPTSFAGPIAVFLNWVNLVATWTVIVTAVAKGIVVSIGYSKIDFDIELDPGDFSLTAASPRGFVQVFILLAGSMCNCGTMPQINADLRTDDRERAIWLLPAVVAALQGLVFLALGFAGYVALGNEIDGDAFAMYAQRYPDWMTVVIQIGLGLLLFLSTPLIMLPAKCQVWAWMSQVMAKDEAGGLEDAPAFARHGINAALVLLTLQTPLFLGGPGMVVLFTVLAGTAANWINLFLPGFVILSMRVIPDRSAGKPWLGSAAISGWILAVGTICAVDAAFQIAALFGPGP